MLGTVVLNHSCAWTLALVSIDVLELHMGRQKSYSILILVVEREWKSLEKLGKGEVCLVTVEHGLYSAPHEMGLLAVIGSTWQAWA